MNLFIIIILSALISLAVSIYYSNHFMKQQEKWMDNFFEEEEKLVEKFIRKL